MGEEAGTFLAEFKPKFARLKQLDKELDELDKKQKELEQAREEVVEELSTGMDDQGVSRVTIDGVTFYRKNDAYPRVKDQDAMFRWLEDLGRGDIIKPAVNAQTLRSLVLELRRENQEMPECIELFIKKRVQTREAKRGN